MERNDKRYQTYVQILKEELIPAMGCTEPIAIAYAAAAARELLGGMPDKVKVGVSDNIIKNVKSVVVPNTDGMRGIESAAVTGILGFHMYQNGQQFKGGEGIVTKGVEATIRNVGQLGREGMRQTDQEIVKIMMGDKGEQDT
jgi:L-cysteine desulfidase